MNTDTIAKTDIRPHKNKISLGIGNLVLFVAKLPTSFTICSPFNVPFVPDIKVSGDSSLDRIPEVKRKIENREDTIK